MEYSLGPVAVRLAELTGRKVVFAEDCIGPAVGKAIAEAKASGGIVLLENLRFYAQEEKNDPEFSKQLAAAADQYVDDAFGAAHRAHASVEGMTRFFLTLDAACDTVVAALTHGAAGEVWVPRVGAARMVDVIEAVRAGAPVSVEVTGIRPGEKLHEQMVSEEEALRSVVHEGYGVITPLVPELPRRQAPALGQAWTSAATDLDVAALQALLDQAGVVRRT